MRDHGTAVKMCYPVKTRGADEAIEKFYFFGGRNGDTSGQIQRFYSDTEKSLINTAKTLGILPPVSAR